MKEYSNKSLPGIYYFDILPKTDLDSIFVKWLRLKAFVEWTNDRNLAQALQQQEQQTHKVSTSFIDILAIKWAKQFIRYFWNLLQSKPMNI